MSLLSNIGIMSYSNNFVSIYNAYINSLSPALWYRLNEISGTTLVNSGSTSSADLTTVGSPPLNVGPAVSFPGLSVGVSFDGSSQRARTSTTNAVGLGTSDFTLIFFVSFPNISRTNDYLYGRGNAGDIIYGYTANTIEFFSASYSGTNPRTGSGISISDANTHMIVYRKEGTTWEGYKDNVNVFSITSSFSLSPTAQTVTLAAAASNADPCECTIYDMQAYNVALSTAELTSIWNKARGL